MEAVRTYFIIIGIAYKKKGEETEITPKMRICTSGKDMIVVFSFFFFFIDLWVLLRCYAFVLECFRDDFDGNHLVLLVCLHYE